MGEDPARGHSRTDPADMSSESGWVTTDVAARAVRVSPRTIRRYIDQGKLEGKLEGEGVRREWLVSVDSLHALRASRPEEEESPRVDREPALADSLADVLRDMAARLELRAEEAAELRVRLELIERTQSTLEDERRRALEELERERAERLGAQERADQLEEERGRLVARYEQTDEEVRELREELEAERSKGLWRRLFGG
jgi:chromosome segregation ATPase